MNLISYFLPGLLSSTFSDGMATAWADSELPLLPEVACPPKHASPELQRLIFYKFIELFYLEKNTTAAFLEFVPEDYVQHNPFLMDGRDASIKGLDRCFSNKTIQVMHLLVDGGYAMIHWRVTGGGWPETAYADLFRFNGTCLVEHWDVIQPIPQNATSRHPLF